MKRILLIAAAVLPAWTAASAQDANTVRIRVGAGAQLKPAFVGADEDKIGPFFRFDIARDSKPFRFKTADDPIGFGLISKNGFSAGPSINFESRRRESDVGAPVGDLSRTIEAGGFVQYDNQSSFRLRADLRQGIDGHKGLVGSVGADKYWRDGDRYVFSVGPRLLFSDDRYQQAFFGVSPQVALATGLPAYKPTTGVHALAMVTDLTYQFSPRVGMFGYARYERLIGDAAKSPIVREFGSRDQYSGGLGLTYTFNVRP